MRLKLFENKRLVHHYSRVEDASFRLVYQERVDVGFFYLREVNEQLREKQQGFFQALKVDWRRVPVALQKLIDVGLLHHSSYERSVQGWKSHGVVLEEFHAYAAHAEQ